MIKTAITFNEIVKYNPTTHQGKGISTAVFDANATGILAPFNGMIVAGIHDEQPSIQGTTITLWEWQTGIGNNAGVNSSSPVQKGLLL